MQRSMNNPSFPSTPGDRRGEDAQKDLLSRLPKGTPHMSSAPTQMPLGLGHGQTYQVTKTLTRQIAPAPGSQVLSAIARPVTAHQITSQNPAVHKKDIQKAPLSLTSTTPVTSMQTGTAISNIIPVQISGASSTPATHGGSTLHVPNVSSIVRSVQPGTAHHPTTFSHLPRGVVAAQHVRAGSVSIQRPTLPTSIQMPAHSTTLPLSLQGSIRNVIPQMMRPGTPPTNRSGSPAVSVGTGQASDSHRASISLHNVTSATSTPSIQITLQASRSSVEGVGKATTTYQPNKVHLTQGMNMQQQPKVVMTHSVTPVMHHPTLAAKGNRGQPMTNSPLSTVTVALSTTTVTIPIISTGTTASSIPIAKVPPQRQHPSQSHIIPTSHSTVHDHRTEPTSYPQPQPAHAHTQPAGQTHTPQSQLQAHNMGLFLNQPHRALPIITTATSNNSHTETREMSLPTMPFIPPYILSQENPYYQQLMRHQIAAQAQANARPGLLPSQTTANLASLQAVSHSVSQAVAGTNLRINHPLMVMADSLRQSTPQTTQPVPTQYHAASTEAGISKVTSTSSDVSVSMTAQPVSMTTQSSGMSVAAVAAVASSLYTVTTQNSHIPQIGQPAPNTPSSTPVNNPSASPRPSILRKRTNEGISAVKKQLAMTTATEVHSPRPEPRPDSTPQSNMSSPKTPASGESQSSTDTALSSEATTPTQPHSDKVKQEPPDPLENGYSTNTPEASPRKRRKQLLQATEEIRDTPVNVFDKLVEACIKEEAEDDDDEEPLSEDDKPEIREEFVDDDGVRWTLEKCRSGVSLLNFYNISWKPKNNHFVRYTDVKPKDERRPTVNELSNQKGVVQKASGWKLFHMAAQIEDLMELEKELNIKIASLQTTLAPTPPLKHSLMEDESGMLHELTQGNIQRCKLISDQLVEAKSSMLKVLDHKPKISEIISKHLSKRPIKKKERT